MTAGDAVRVASRPLLQFFNKRFEDLFQHVTNEVAGAKQSWREELRSALELQRGATVETVDALGAGVVTLAQGSILLQQAASRLERTLLDATTPAEADAIVKRLADEPAMAQAVAALIASRPLAELPEWVADLANWLSSHRSPLAEQGLWLNHPVTVKVAPGDVSVAAVNERIVEIPYVLAAASRAPDGPALDLGAAESTVALSLASSGRPTYALDPRGYPFSHPLLTVVRSPVEKWEGPAEPLALAISLSTVEHLGLHHYSPEQGDVERADRDTLEQIRRWMAPGGVLVLTAPYGRESIDEFQRVYGASSLRRLLDGWQVEEIRYAHRLDERTWAPCEADDLADAEVAGVVLARATAP
jgi:hypothetical protein